MIQPKPPQTWEEALATAIDKQVSELADHDWENIVNARSHVKSIVGAIALKMANFGYATAQMHCADKEILFVETNDQGLIKHNAFIETIERLQKDIYILKQQNSSRSILLNEIQTQRDEAIAASKELFDAAAGVREKNFVGSDCYERSAKAVKRLDDAIAAYKVRVGG